MPETQDTLPLPDAPTADEAIGTEPVGRYHLGKEIGRGGQARVLLATDAFVGRTVAWKELLPPAARAGAADGTATARFLREARITGQLDHPAIVPVHELGRRANGQLYYTMRLVRGESLADRLGRCEGLDDRLKLLGAFWDICNAVAFAHSRGVIHRDLKPANVMVGAFGETVVLDWGLAKVRGVDDPRGAELAEQVRLLQGAGSETLAGWAVGTPSYMSPEQADGRIDAVDERSDVWGLGAVLYEILTGRPPFVGTNPYHVVAQVRSEPVARVLGQCPEAPPELAAVAEKALQREPSGRYPSAAALAEEVSAYMTGRRVQAYGYSSWELLRRFAARHKAAVAATFVVVAAILASLVVVSVAWRGAREARDQEHAQRLATHSTLAEAYQLQADRLLQEGQPLPARVFAAASLSNNPANPAGPHHDAGFGLLHPEAERLLVRASSRLYQTGFRPVERLEERVQRDDGLMDVAFSPNGRLVATAEYGKGITVRDVAARRDVLRVPDRGKVTYGLAFLPAGRLATAGREPALQVWDIAQGRPLLTVDEPDLDSSFVAASPDGRWLATRAVDPGTVALRDAADGRTVRAFQGRGARVVGAAFSPDGARLAIATLTDPVRVVEIATGRTLFEVPGQEGSYTYWACFSPEGARLLTAHTDGTARIWDAASGAAGPVLRAPEDSFYYAAFSPDGATIATAGARGSVRLWAAASGYQLALLGDHRDAVSVVAFSPDGALLASAGYDRVLRLWRLRAQDGLTRWQAPGTLRRLAWSPDGARLATLGDEGLLCLWDRDDATPRACTQQARGEHSALGWTPDGAQVITGGAHGVVSVLDGATGMLVRSFQAHDITVWCLDVSPDGRLLATGSADRTVRLWDLASGAMLHALAGPTAHLWAVRFSDDGKLLAGAGGAEPIHLWEVPSGRPLRRLEGHTDWVAELRWLPGGHQLVSGSRDSLALLWDADSGQVLRRFAVHETAIERMALHGPTRRLATVDRAGRLLVWDLDIGEPCLWLLRGAGSEDLAFSPDGRQLVVLDANVATAYPLDVNLDPGDPGTVLRAAERDAARKLRGFELVPEGVEGGN